MTTLKRDPQSNLEVRKVLQMLLAEVQSTLRDDFVGLYVHGSLASGDFATQRSDIDFLVVTKKELNREMLPALEAMHIRITQNGGKWATRL